MPALDKTLDYDIIYISMETHGSPLECLLEQLTNVHPDHALAAEPFGPLGEAGLGQTLLLAREREGEAQGKLVVLQVVLLDKLADTVGDVVKQLDTNKEGRRGGTHED